MTDAQLERATEAVRRCLEEGDELCSTASPEFYRHVAAETLQAARPTSVHDRAVAALAAWLNGSDHEVENYLYHAAKAALRLLNREELGWLGITLEAQAEASLNKGETT
jgi:hypothetical protein